MSIRRFRLSRINFDFLNVSIEAQVVGRLTAQINGPNVDVRKKVDLSVHFSTRLGASLSSGLKVPRINEHV